MRIRDEISRKYWREAAIEELAETYAAQGYDIQRGAQIGNYPADLLIKKGEELVVFAVKSDDWSKEKIKEVQNVRHEVVHQLGGKFNLILASPPQEKVIEVTGIEDILLSALQNDPQELSELAMHTTIEGVSDAMITSVRIEKNRIHAEGSGVVSVEIQWGSNGDNHSDRRIAATDNFPFQFKLLFDGNLNILATPAIEVDVSSFYE